MSASLEVFRQKFLGPIDQYLAWHDGYSSFTDFDLLDQLSPPDQQTAAAELLHALEKRKADPRAMLGLGHLRYRPALPALHTCLSTSGTYALEAIARIDPSELQVAQVQQVLHANAEKEYVLLELLIGLGHFYTRQQLSAQLLQQIFELLAHPKYLVRYHALAAMRNLYGLAQTNSTTAAQVQADTIFSHITSDKRPADYRKAQQLLLADMRANGTF